MWFTIANVAQIGIAVMSALMFCPIVTMDTDHERLGFIRDTGDEPYSRLIVLYPFIVILGTNIQLGLYLIVLLQQPLQSLHSHFYGTQISTQMAHHKNGRERYGKQLT
ncbi:UNVERIFIED_ORG: hypothetical protein [Escherichia phage CMSTMSU]